jgi:flagellar motor switch/type III secretory pathway protein FliN
MAQQPKSAPHATIAGSGAPQIAAEAALVQSTEPPEAAAGGLVIDSAVARIPIEVDVAVPIRNFRLRNLLALEHGQVIESMWTRGEDLPLAAPGSQLAWSEFEVIDQKLAVRITRLV